MNEINGKKRKLKDIPEEEKKVIIEFIKRGIDSKIIANTVGCSTASISAFKAHATRGTYA